MLDASGRNLRLPATVTDILVDNLTSVAALRVQDAGVTVPFLPQLTTACAVMRFTRRQRLADRQAMSIGPEVDLGREATARAPKTLAMARCRRRRTTFAPAAQW